MDGGLVISRKSRLRTGLIAAFFFALVVLTFLSGILSERLGVVKDTLLGIFGLAAYAYSIFTLLVAPALLFQFKITVRPLTLVKFAAFFVVFIMLLHVLTARSFIDGGFSGYCARSFESGDTAGGLIFAALTYHTAAALGYRSAVALYAIALFGILLAIVIPYFKAGRGADAAGRRLELSEVTRGGIQSHPVYKRSRAPRSGEAEKERVGDTPAAGANEAGGLKKHRPPDGGDAGGGFGVKYKGFDPKYPNKDYGEDSAKRTALEALYGTDETRIIIDGIGARCGADTTERASSAGNGAEPVLTDKIEYEVFSDPSELSDEDISLYTNGGRRKILEENRKNLKAAEKGADGDYYYGATDGGCAAKSGGAVYNPRHSGNYDDGTAPFGGYDYAAARADAEIAGTGGADYAYGAASGGSETTPGDRRMPNFIGSDIADAARYLREEAARERLKKAEEDKKRRDEEAAARADGFNRVKSGKQFGFVDDDGDEPEEFINKSGSASLKAGGVSDGAEYARKNGNGLKYGGKDADAVEIEDTERGGDYYEDEYGGDADADKDGEYEGYGEDGTAGEYDGGDYYKGGCGGADGVKSTDKNSEYGTGNLDKNPACGADNNGRSAACGKGNPDQSFDKSPECEIKAVDKNTADGINAANSGGPLEPIRLPTGTRLAGQHTVGGGMKNKNDKDKQLTFEEIKPVRRRAYVAPPVELLLDRSGDFADDSIEIESNMRKLEECFAHFKINATRYDALRGPTFTRYELQMPPGIPVSKVVNLDSNISMVLASKKRVRIEAPIPGKNAFGIEVPNKKSYPVGMRELVDTDEFYGGGEKGLRFTIGKDISGENYYGDITDMPHLLIAGSTGSGKSCCLNALIVSLLYRYTPEEVRLILIDPKRVELNQYNGLPHLLLPETIKDEERALNALDWVVKEMKRRYELMSESEVNHIDEYNRGVDREDRLYRIVIIVDEVAELVTSMGRDFDDRIKSIAQLARAAGIHVILATQRPSVDIITGVIKSNLPSRIAFAVMNNYDSQTILGRNGAEKLLGKGDMLFQSQNMPEPVRLQGVLIERSEINEIVKFIKENNEAYFDAAIDAEVNTVKETTQGNADAYGNKSDGKPAVDDLFVRAVNLVIENGGASIAVLQRKFAIGFSRAGRIMDMMEEMKIVGKGEGAKPRPVLMTLDEFYETYGDLLQNEE
ncbi:MAG: hypothetical protein LBP79_06155 [Clostridiales bacterium]|jgi:hypothetical protein|nr:hypothetical protein [Clostridiales bacterium]